MSLNESLDMRVFKHKGISFHPKTYIFQDEDNGEIYIGSSNISMSALEYGMEWNYKIVKNHVEEDFNQFVDNFNNLFEEHAFKLDDEALKNYSIDWKKNRLFDDVGKEGFDAKGHFSENSISEAGKAYEIIQHIEPYGAQIEALYHLNKTREEGMDKGLVVMATGVGKTYLAAFDCLKYKKILFIAHREEILKQAYASFQRLMPEKSFGVYKAAITQKMLRLYLLAYRLLGNKSI
jgi:hypothetical protein